MEAIIKRTRAPRACALCRKFGHYSRTCPEFTAAEKIDSRLERWPEQRSAPALVVVDEAVQMVAQMREECDALATETVEYEAVRVRVEERITQNRRRIQDLQMAIAKMRRVK